MSAIKNAAVMATQPSITAPPRARSRGLTAYQVMASPTSTAVLTAWVFHTSSLPNAGRRRPTGCVPSQAKVGGCDQPAAQLKSTPPPENSAPMKLTSAPENLAEPKATSPSENVVFWKLTVK